MTADVKSNANREIKFQMFKIVYKRGIYKKMMAQALKCTQKM